MLRPQVSAGMPVLDRVLGGLRAQRAYARSLRTARVGVGLVCRWNGENFAWTDCGADGSTLAVGTRDVLRAAVRGRPWAALYPAEKMLLTSVTVPTRRRKDVQQAARYAIEETLAGDVEKAHLVIAPDGTSSRYAAAVTDAEDLREYLRAFGDPSDWPTYIVPEILALPWKEGEWTFARDGDRVVLRLDRWSGLAFRTDALEDNLAVLAGERHELSRAVLVIPSDPPSEQALTRAGLTARAGGPEPYLSHCARALASGLPLDLRASGDFARPVHGPKTWSVAMLAGCVLGASLLLNGALLWELWSAQREHAALSTTMATHLAAFDPPASNVARAQAVLARRLQEAQLQNTARQRSFLVLSGHLAEALAAVPAASLRELRYEQGVLEAQIEAPSLSALDEIRRRVGTVPAIQEELANVMATSRERAVGRITIGVTDP